MLRCLVALLAVVAVNGFSGGAGSCDAPGVSAHGSGNGAISFGGLRLEMDGRGLSSSSATTVEAGAQKTLVLSGKSFRGFLIKATGAAALTSSDGQSKDCGAGGGAVTHSSATPRSSVTAVWTAPSSVGTHALVITVVVSQREWYQTSFAVDVVAKGPGTVVYTHSNGVRSFNINNCCAAPFGYCNERDAARRACFLHRPVLTVAATQAALDQVIVHGSVAHLCNYQSTVCAAIEENQGLSSDCGALRGSCRAALRHLHAMMFNQSPQEGEPQVCNNFARKSIRGFFHDFMSNGIEGSILAEHHLAHNFGLCRWAQYVNVLSDETGCDPGSVVAMAGQLGYQACGVHLWDLDVAAKPAITLSRPFPCAKNFAGSKLFDGDTAQRAERFSDTQLSANSTAMEEFWYAANAHTHKRPDGEVEYSAEAGAAAHAVGRVTCDPDGFDFEGKPAAFQKGFFHVQRAAGAPLTAKAFFNEAMSKITGTQCVASSKGDPHADKSGKRQPSARWPHVHGETDMNPEGGFCSMPTHFLGTVRTNGKHRIPRWVSITEHSFPKAAAWSAHQSACRSPVKLFVPWEVLNLTDVALVASPALARFEAIAWHGVNSIASAWDSCEVGCALPVLENRLCKGGAAPVLRDYDWTKGYCDQGIAGSEYTCCAKSCGACTAGAGADACASRAGGAALCCPASIASVGAECKSSWDVGCLVPKTGDGGVCASHGECRSGVCKGGRCCNKKGQGAECASCSQSGGGCHQCAAGFKSRGAECVDACACSPGCVTCDCGRCTACNATSHVLCPATQECYPKKPAGSPCGTGDECTSGRCAGGNCCNVARLAPGCAECNSRGLCSKCGAGFTLCGHWKAGEGQCKPTISELTTKFRCGTGGAASDYPSTDGYNYCGMANHCPCASAGCYMECKIPHTCWAGSTADGLTAYEPPEFVGFVVAPTPAATAAPTPSAAPGSAPTRAPSLAPTRAPTRAPTPVPSPAPSPQPTFAVASVAVVVPTKLTGFSKATFTAGVQQAYRQAMATKAGATIDQVLLSNIRDVVTGDTRMLAAAATVDFDVGISVASRAAANAMQAAVQAVPAGAVAAAFKQELFAVKAAGNFADIASINVAALEVSVTQGAAVAAVVTAAPTPAVPVDNNTVLGLSKVVLVAAAAAVVGLVLLALVATTRKSKRSRKPVPCANSDPLRAESAAKFGFDNPMKGGAAANFAQVLPVPLEST
jgi:hypothetical protein